MSDHDQSEFTDVAPDDLRDGLCSKGLEAELVPDIYVSSVED
jgi:hypothetical protein